MLGKKCSVCGTGFEYKSNKLYCSSSCRKKAEYFKAKIQRGLKKLSHFKKEEKKAKDKGFLFLVALIRSDKKDYKNYLLETSLQSPLLSTLSNSPKLVASISKLSSDNSNINQGNLTCNNKKLTKQ